MARQAVPRGHVRRVQGARIPVTEDHGHVELGTVAHLELAGRHLWCVAELPGEEVDPDRMPTYWFSVAPNSRRDYSDSEITHVGLVAATAQSGTAPVRFIPGTIHDAPRDTAVPRLERRILQNADDTVRHRSRGGPIQIRDP